MRFPPVCVDHLRHAYGKHKVYEDLSLSFEMGKIYGMMGKNGVGKTTLIKIIMGFLKPLGGSCRIFGDPAHAIRPATRERVGLLFERHLAYDFFTIAQVERFMAAFYPRWKAERYHALVDVLGLPSTHRIAHMSEGQRSQVVLGLMLAQDPDLLVLDDYSLGLDAGYRRLFVDCLCEFLRDGRHTVILTSHVIQDMDRFVDEAIFLRRGGDALKLPLRDFMDTFRCYRLQHRDVPDATARDRLDALACGRHPLPDGLINAEAHSDHYELFGFVTASGMAEALARTGLSLSPATMIPTAMNLEDAFIGYTGRR